MSGTVTHLTVGRDFQSARVFLLPCDLRPQHPKDVWPAGSHPWELRPEERWAVPTQAFQEPTQTSRTWPRASQPPSWPADPRERRRGSSAAFGWTIRQQQSSSPPPQSAIQGALFTACAQLNNGPQRCPGPVSWSL